MGELLRPPPPRTWRERAAARTAGIAPARAASGAGAVLVVAVTAWWLLRPGRLPVEATLPRAASTTTVTRQAAASPPSAAAPATVAVPSAVEVPSSDAAGAPLVVQAAGAVRHPGVFHLPATARVADLVEAAGGATDDADVDQVALAARLTDGQRVVVPRRGDPVTTSRPPAVPDAAIGPIDLNAATTADLDRLPGVGPATAVAIVTYRGLHGRFISVDELAHVPGIGAAKLEALRPLVKV
jgi:competence protein ComEA